MACVKEYGGLSAEQLAAKSTFTNRVDLEGAESNVPRLRDAGVLFAAGTDAVYPGDFQGEGLHRELELLVESGLSPLQAITAATKNAAAIVNASAEWGTLEPGKLANLILVDGKPDRRIGDTRRIALVMKEGARHRPPRAAPGSLAHPGLSGDRILDGARLVASSIFN